MKTTRDTHYNMMCVVFIALIIIAGCDAVTYVRKSESVNMTIKISTTFINNFNIRAPNGAIIVEKSNNICRLTGSSSKFQLLSTNCTYYVQINILDAIAADAGDYVCSPASCRERLVVLGQPTKPRITKSGYRITLNSRVSLTCLTRSTTMPIRQGLSMSYTWFINGVMSLNKGKMLVIPRVQISNFNITYVCMVKEYTGQSSDKSYPLRFTFSYVDSKSLKISINNNSSSRQNLTYKSSMRIVCTVEAYPAVSYFYIRRNGINIKTVRRSNIIQFDTNSTCDDLSRYYCYLSHSLTRRSSSSIYVTKLCPPFLYSRYRNQSLLFYGLPAISKTIYVYITASPKANYSIVKVTDDGLMQLPANYEIDKLSNGFKFIIMNFTEEAHGVYQFTAENSVGVLMRNITITDGTQTPKNLIAWSTTPNSVHLSWTAGGDHDFKITYYPLYKEDRKAWKKGRYMTDHGSQITLTLHNLLPGTKYFFMVRASTKELGRSFYSNLADTVTINKGDTPQSRPVILHASYPVTHPHTHPYTHPDTYAIISTTTGPSANRLIRQQHTALDTETSSFGAGVGVGLAVGVAVAIVTVIMTIAYLKRSKQKIILTNEKGNPTRISPPDTAIKYDLQLSSIA